MLISYPILPLPAAHTGESDLDAFLRTYVHPDQGLYPVSRRNRWHGGIHLNPGTEPIRAIADGDVLAYRCASVTESYDGVGNYDTSFVLLKHTTETGDHTPVVFYSLYMHLKLKSALTAAQFAQLPAFMRSAAPSATATSGGTNKVFRKDVLGFGGQLYQHSGACVHFEIFATDADFGHFWKDSTAIAQGGAGSTDFFGDAGFVIPQNKSFAARHPHADAQHRISLGGTAHYSGNDKLPIGQAGNNSGGELYVSVRLDKGQRTSTTYRKLANGDHEQVGTPVTQTDYEYELYRLASHLYTDCPSAGYEWLRFGRVLGPDTTVTNENWQLVRYGAAAAEMGYIDLAANGNSVSKLSDADFPHWLGWKKIDVGDDAFPEDGICDVAALQTVLHIPTDASKHSLCEPPDFVTQATDPAIAKKLRLLVCKFRSEWDDSNLDNPTANPYEHLKQTGHPLADPAAWTKFKNHVQKLAFWSTSGLAGKVWHFHPLQFVDHYRSGGWLSLNELALTMPCHMFYSGTSTHKANTQGLVNTLSLATAKTRLSQHFTALNKTMRKYVITTGSRQACFLSQVLLETAQWRNQPPNRVLLQEWFFGQYSSANPATQYYTAFFGRGIMQLTWAGNYRDYGNYRSTQTLPNHTGPYVERLSSASPRITATSRHYSASPSDGGAQFQWAPRYDPDIIATDPYNACDSGGYYWVSKHHSGVTNINRKCDEAYSAVVIGKINAFVNGGGNGYHERQAYTFYSLRQLTDSIGTGSVVSITTPRGPVAVNCLRPTP
ncbi:putative chitinase [Rhodanobacter sp. TND4EL1]